MAGWPLAASGVSTTERPIPLRDVAGVAAMGAPPTTEAVARRVVAAWVLGVAGIAAAAREAAMSRACGR